MNTLLKRVDFDANMNRWYLVLVQPTLFESVAVICMWGSRETSYQQIRIIPAPSTAEAERIAEEIIAAKIKRGYKRVENVTSGGYQDSLTTTLSSG